MRFHVLGAGVRPPIGDEEVAYLVKDNWNDWFTYRTSYTLFVSDADGRHHVVGMVKIGQKGMKEGQAEPELPQDFTSLSEEFFSVGQEDKYYESLTRIGPSVRDEVLVALRDVAKNDVIFDQAMAEPVTQSSLLRSITKVAVEGQFRRMAAGGARLSEYRFKYSLNPSGSEPGSSCCLDFKVVPESSPPSNVHVVIGRNGVGKTRLLCGMAKSFAGGAGSSSGLGVFISEDSVGKVFANLVSVSFSAFDEFLPLAEKKPDSGGFEVAYVGLRRVVSGGSEAVAKSPNDLAEEFGKSAVLCSKGDRLRRWKKLLRGLEADPIFKEAEVSSLADVENDQVEVSTSGVLGAAVDEHRYGKLFKGLSSGHKVVLLTITRLVELVEERTLVLLDEPEAHLHPPLLSAFVRSLSDLLIDRNGVAIVATHSPVLLQEVPNCCVWAMRRSGNVVAANRMECETFGENVGVLTREVFGLEVTSSGFHKMLRDVVDRGGDYEEVVSEFGGKLGGEAKAIVRSLIAAREQKDAD